MMDAIVPIIALESNLWLTGTGLCAAVLALSLALIRLAMGSAHFSGAGDVTAPDQIDLRGPWLWSGGFTLIFIGLLLHPQAGSAATGRVALAMATEAAGFLLLLIGHLRYFRLPIHAGFMMALALACAVPILSALVLAPTLLDLVGMMTIGLLAISGGILLLGWRMRHGAFGSFMAGCGFILFGILQALAPGLESSHPVWALYALNIAPALQFTAGIGLILMMMQTLLRERQRITGKLKNQASTLHAVFDSIAQGIIVTDPEGRIIGVNRHALDYFDLPDMPIGDKPDFASLMRDWAQRHDYDDARIAALLPTASAPASLTVELPQKEGRIVEIRRDLKPEGGYVYCLSDITGRKDMEDKLRHLAATDSLTGLNNRRRFMELAEAELLRARRFGHPLSVMMIDIDHFKPINDTYGHLTGDEVIRMLAHLITDNLRKIDVAGRVGGEEYAVFLPETPIEAAHDVAERLRKGACALSLSTPKGTVRFTISIGLAQLGETDEDFTALLSRADTALYTAKRQGRNRVQASEA